MKNKIKKIIVFLLILLLFYLVLDSYLFNKKNEESKFKFRITYMFIDYDKTPKNAKMSDYYSDDEETLFYSQTYEDVIEEKKYYVVHIKNINSIALDNIAEYAFAKNNVLAQMINDIKFDEKKRNIYIPKKYFKNSKKGDIPLKMEILSRVKKSQLKNIKINVKTEKILPKSKITLVNNNDLETKASIFKYNRGNKFTKNDFKVYVNNNNIPLSKNEYDWNSKSGTITLDKSSIEINNINVKFKKISLFKQIFWIFSMDVVSAKNTYTSMGTFTDTGDTYVNLINATATTKNTPYFYKGSSSEYFCGGNTGIKVSSSVTSFNCTKQNGAAYYFTNSSDPSAYKAYKKAKKNSTKTSNPDAKKYVNQDFLVKVSKLESKSFSRSAEEKTKDANGKDITITHTRTVNVEFNKDWAELWCTHVADGNSNNDSTGLDLTYEIVGLTSSKLSMKIDKGGTTVGNQEATGYFRFTKDSVSLKVQKKVYSIGLSSGAIGDGSNLSLEDISFSLYGDRNADGSCKADTYIMGADTDANGVATFNGLDANETYCVQEDYTEADPDSSVSSMKYVRVNKISGWSAATVTPTPGNEAAEPLELGKGQSCSTNGSTATCNYYNTLVRYCFKVNKRDLNNAGAVFNSGTVKACDSFGNCTTNSDNQLIFAGYDYDTVKNGLTISESTDTTPVNSGSETYYNTFHSSNGTQTSSITLPFSTAIAMSLNKDANGYYWSCPATNVATDAYDVKKYQCLVVNKVDQDSPSSGLAGAQFSASCTNGQTSTATSKGSNGKTVLYAGKEKSGITTTCNVTELKPPKGFGLTIPSTKNNLSVWTMPESTAAAYAGQSDDQVAAAVENWCGANSSATFENPSLKLNWYKVLEDSKTKINTTDSNKTAKFSVTSPDGKKVYHTASKKNVTNSNKTETRSCYVYSETSTGAGSDIFESDANGQVCITSVPGENSEYTITETSPGQYHTFGDVNSLKVKTSTDFAAMTVTGDEVNTFINYPTRFEFGKNIVSSYSSTDEGSYKDLTTSELRKLKFNVTDVSGQIVRFKKKRDANNNVIEGEYEYLDNTIDPQGEEEVTDLQLNSDRKIIIWHLPWADASNADGALYSIKEKVEDGCTDQNGNTCNGNGFYYPEYNNASDYQFRIYKTSNPVSVNKTEPKQSLSNTPTEIKFTKDDIYCKDSNCNSNYQNGTNGTTQDSVFENEEEIKVFDDIQFVLRDSTGRDVTDHLIKVSDNEYRFVKDVNTLSDELKAKLVKTDSSVVGNNLHTKDGTLKITHLCRESTYYIEEYKVPEHTVFILPTTIQFNGTVPSNWNWKGHPYVTYKVSNKESTKKTTPYSDTQVIDNTPTRILIYKKDSKYDYLIPDETTTFQLYRCKKGEECHPTDDPDNTENYERVRFWNRALIPGDKEDYKNDKTGLQTEVYKFVSTSDEKSMSESDLKSKTTYDLHPDHGVLVFRYLPANYNYVLVETVAPKNYQLPVGRNAETSFKVVDNTVQVEDKDLPNKPTSVLIKKYADDGKLLKGAEFKIYEVEDSNVCSKNLSPVNQKKKLLKLKTIRDGVYEARPEGDTDTIVTCSDRDDAKCSDIKTFVSKELTTKLTHDKYEDSWSKFEDESTSTAEGRQIELQEGVALIQYLEYDHCYVIEETKAPEGYSLPELKKRYTTITIKKNDEFAHDTNKDLINSPTPFKFYKYDEFNKLIDGAEFKLQKLDDNKKYQDVTVTEIPTENGELFYKVDKDTDNTLIKTKGGTATIYYLTAGQYRVVETKAPGNKVLSKNLNLATFFVDENGSVYGNSIIVNRSIVKTPVKNSASAELIVTIQTGQTVIRYGIVIAVLVGMISGLMILKEKKSRKDYNKDEK